ncbi:MAG: dihydrolipoamide acetyltransferase family protein [Blastococcus sp.]
MRMPEVAAGGTSAVLHEWSVAERAEFSALDVLATVETDKAVVDVEAEQGGVVLKLLVTPGTSVEVGAPIAVLADAGETVDDVDAVLLALGAVQAASVTPDPEGAPDQPASPAVPDAAVPATVGSGIELRGTAGNATGNGHGRIFASPLARRLARDAGLPLAGLHGTGPGGRIVRRDVEAASAGRNGATASPATVTPPQADVTDVPHTPMRRAIARRLTESKQTIPHFTLRATLRVDELLRLRSGLAAVGTKVSVTDLLLKAAARAHTVVPRMNAIWTPDATRLYSSVDLAVAVATPTGLLTPVVRGVERLPVAGIAATVGDLVARAREGRLRQDELEGGSFTLTNLGMFGTEEFAAIINPPQSAILAVGAAREEPVVQDGALAVGTVVHVTLSADHRVIDGALAAEWMAAFVASVEEPLRLLV